MKTYRNCKSCEEIASAARTVTVGLQVLSISIEISHEDTAHSMTRDGEQGSSDSSNHNGSELISTLYQIFNIFDSSESHGSEETVYDTVELIVEMLISPGQQISSHKLKELLGRCNAEECKRKVVHQLCTTKDEVVKKLSKDFYYKNWNTG